VRCAVSSVITLVLLRLGQGCGVRDDGIVAVITRRHRGSGFFRNRGIGSRLDRQFVLGANVAMVDTQASVMSDADEGAGARDLRRIIGERTRFETLERPLQLAKPVVDLVRQFLDAGVFLRQAVVFILHGVALAHFVGG
jgi:hypothetical protein